MLVLVLCSARSASADPSKAAEGVFQAGREALGRSDLDTACARFRESFRLDPAPGALLNLGECEAKRDRVASAWQAFHDALALLPPSDFRVKYARERADLLSPRVPTVRVRLARQIAGARVLLDGVELQAPSLEVPLPLDPGDHRLTVRASGRVDAETRVHVDERDRRELAVAPGPALPAGPAVQTPAPPPPAGASARSIGTIAALGVGIAGVAAGTVTGLLAMDAAATYRAHCPDAGCDEQGMSAAARGQVLTVASTASFAAGAIGLATFAVLLATGRPDRSGSSARAWIGPSASPSKPEAGVVVGGRF